MKITTGVVKFIVSIIVLICGMVMVFFSMFLPPVGVIDPSVLALVGEIFTFVGAVWGIGQYATIQIAKINRSQDRSSTSAN